jgi:hypothetical protein
MSDLKNFLGIPGVHVLIFLKSGSSWSVRRRGVPSKDLRFCPAQKLYFRSVVTLAERETGTVKWFSAEKGYGCAR